MPEPNTATEPKRPAAIDALTPTVRGEAHAPSIAMHPTRATWKDWAGPGALDPDPSDELTRDQLVAKLQAEGVKVDARDLVFWQGRGVLPYPVKRREGRTSHAYYAPWVADLVRELRRLQDKGRTLNEIRWDLIDMASRLGRIPHPLEANGTSALTGEADLATDTVSVSATDSGGATGSERADVVIYAITSPVISGQTTHALSGQVRTAQNVTVALVAAPKGLAHLATAIARMYEEQNGTKIARVEVGLTDEQGVSVAFAFSTTP